MRVYATSDLHGQIPHLPPDAREGDILLIAGDICPDFEPRGREGNFRQANWLDTSWRAFLEHARNEGLHVVATWGNHDFVGEHRNLIPDLPWILLIDHEVTIEGVRIYGTPWVPKLSRWAFYGDARKLTARAEAIPAGLDILMTHGPPYGVADVVPWTIKYGEKYGTPPEGESVGDRTLNSIIEDRDPGVVICGHIHEAAGFHMLGTVPVINVAALDGSYQPYSTNFWTTVAYYE